MHNRYGPVVRTAPNVVSFNSGEAFKEIYGYRPDHLRFEKHRGAYVVPYNGVDHIVSAVNHETHARHRRLLSHVFSERELKGQEGLIRTLVDTMIIKLREKVWDGEGNNVDLASWMNFITFDITGDLMLGEPFGSLKDGKTHPWVESLFDSVKALAVVGVLTQYPFLQAMARKLIPKSLSQKEADHFNFGAQKADQRLERGAERPDFMSAIMKNGFSEKEGRYQENEKIMSRSEIHSTAFLLIIAGSETTATLLSGCIYYLCKTQPVMERLVNEIRTAFKSDEEITFNEAEKLQYLNAVIEESLRIYPPIPVGLPRIIPAGGASVAGHYVPENTVVSGQHYAAYHSPTNFTLPDSFIPERWLGTDPRFADDKKFALQPFSTGPRNCIGKHLAYAEIRLIICKLFFNFDINTNPEATNWKDQKVHFLWDRPPLMVTLKERAAKN